MRRKRYRINDLVTSLDDERSPRELLARTLSVPQEELGRVRVIRRSLDARSDLSICREGDELF